MVNINVGVMVNIQMKKEKIIKIANEYREIIPQKVYDALLNYKVEITLNVA